MLLKATGLASIERQSSDSWAVSRQESWTRRIKPRTTCQSAFLKLASLNQAGTTTTTTTTTVGTRPQVDNKEEVKKERKCYEFNGKILIYAFYSNFNSILILNTQKNETLTRSMICDKKNDNATELKNNKININECFKNHPRSYTNVTLGASNDSLSLPYSDSAESTVFQMRLAVGVRKKVTTKPKNYRRSQSKGNNKASPFLIQTSTSARLLVKDFDVCNVGQERNNYTKKKLMTYNVC